MSNFYDDSYEPRPRASPTKTCDLGSPTSIFSYLDKNVYKQDEYKKTASIILYEHLHGHKGKVTLVCGPAGCGKTLVAETLKQIYPKILIANAASISKDGWTGSNKLSDILIQGSWDYGIIFLDEIDKLIAPQHNSSSENVSAGLQAELLKALDGETLRLKDSKGEFHNVRCNEFSWVLAGSFAAKAEQIKECKSSSGLGFGATKTDYAIYSEKLTLQDLIDFGMLPELASRINRMVAVEPLSSDDYMYLLTKHRASPLRKLEREYNMKLNLPQETLKQIANDAYESGLGLRNCKFQLQKLIDDKVFAAFQGDKNTALNNMH